MSGDSTFSIAATSPASSTNNYVTVTVTYDYQADRPAVDARSAVAARFDHTEPVGHHALSGVGRLPCRDMTCTDRLDGRERRTPR